MTAIQVPCTLGDRYWVQTTIVVSLFFLLLLIIIIVGVSILFLLICRFVLDVSHVF